MEPADSCRRAAHEAVADVEPPRLHDLVETILDGASMVPGVFTLESAAVAASSANGSGSDRDHDIDVDGATERDAPTNATGATIDALDASTTDAIVTHAAGVQLIYEGLRLTRTLAHDEPWLDADASDVDGDLEILAADILVARGFYLLARTDAAGTAVRTVQSFGRDQTRRDDLLGDAGASDPDTTDTDPAALDTNLERDVLELAVQTGAAAVDESPPARLLALSEDVADGVGSSFPPAAEWFAAVDTSISEQPAEDRSLEEGPTDRATSATDP